MESDSHAIVVETHDVADTNERGSAGVRLVASGYPSFEGWLIGWVLTEEEFGKVVVVEHHFRSA